MEHENIIRALEDKLLAVDKRIQERNIENAIDTKIKEGLILALKTISEAYGLAPQKAYLQKKIDIDDNSSLGYPEGPNVLAKMIYYQTTTDHVWRKNNFSEFLEKVGEKKLKKIEKFLSAKLNYYVKKKKLYKVQWGGSVAYTYYTTRKDWFAKNEKGKYYLLPQYYPSASELTKLKNPDKIVVEGIE